MSNEKSDNCQKGKPREGRYANCFQIGQNEFEFLIDFGQSYSQKGKEDFHTRIICNPFYANVLLKLLQKSIKEYEERFGILEEDNEEL